MRLLLLTFAIAVGLNFIMYRLSGNLLKQVSSTHEQAVNRRVYLTANGQIHRSLALFSVGLATGKAPFLVEARRSFADASKGLQSISGSASAHVPKAEVRDVEERLSKKEMGQKELLGLMNSIEDLSMKLSVREHEWWKAQLQSSEGLLAEYETLNLVINGVGISLTLLLSALGFFLHRKYRLEEEISRESRLKSSLFTSLNEAIFVTDSKGTVTSCNHSCVRLTGLDSRLVVGRPLSSFFGDARFEREGAMPVKWGWHDLAAKGKNMTGLHMHSRVRGQERWFSINLQPVLTQKEGNDFAMIFSFTDITEQVFSKKKIKEQQERIVESSKSELVAQMAGGIAHEISNPLTIISSSMELLEMKAKDKDMLESAVIQKSTTKVLDTIGRLGKIVNGMLALSRKGEMTKEPAPVGGIIETAVDFSRILLEKAQVEVRIKEENLETKVECHPIQISQVLINLIKNSVEAIRGLEDRWIDIGVETSEEGASIRITDSGIGMSDDLKERIMLPFFTSKKIGEGTGLGLSISRTIVENHGGRLEVSRETRNTQFIIFIPYKQEEFKAAA